MVSNCSAASSSFDAVLSQVLGCVAHNLTAEFLRQHTFTKSSDAFRMAFIESQQIFIQQVFFPACF